MRWLGGASGPPLANNANLHARRNSRDTVDAALANAADALRDWTELTEEKGDPLPAPRILEALREEPDVIEALAAGASLAAVPLVRETGKPVKANLSLDAGLLAAIDAEARRRQLTRSAFVELIARRVLSEVA
jgi:predicted RNase H-like HicB family nuclease